MRLRLASVARAELEERKRAMMVMTYDDLVTRLKSALEGPGGAAVAAQLRARYEVVLVDEFQDTDPAQWEIMRLAFGDSPTRPATLVLIADPKQAIYAFRGADVYAYLDAARAAGTQATLPINWRSDQGLIDAHDALFSGVRLGHEGIAYRQVRAADEHQATGLTGAPVAAPLRVRVALRADLPQTPRGYARAPDARRHVVCDVAADIVTLLSSGAAVAAAGAGAAGVGAAGAGTASADAAGAEAVRPAHIAVLVRTNRQAAMIREALEDVGVPAVINGAGSVFGTEPARQWLRLLEALERPASITRAHSAALTAFVGWPAERLAAADEDSWEWEEVHRRLHEWARVLRTRGVASLLETVMRDATEGPALAARVLGDSTGERSLTDLRHIGQLLHAAASEEQLGPTALTGWLRTRIAEAEVDTADEERSRRLESDAEAVQVLTIHRSKGLEFPVVYLPFLWEAGYIPDKPPRPVFFHDPEAGDERTIDVALEGPTSRATRSSSSASSGARTCGWPTSRSPARAIRRWCGGRARSTAATHRWRGCCSPAPTAATWSPAAARPRQTRRSSTASGRSPTPPAARAGRSASSAPSWASRRSGARSAPRPTSSPWRRFSAASTCAGGARPTATSPRPATRSG